MEQPGFLKKTDYISSPEVEEFVMFHNVSIQGHVKLFMCPPVILQIILPIVPHLISNFLKVLSGIGTDLCLVWTNRVIMPVCFFHHQLYDFEKKSMKHFSAVVFSDVGCLFLVTHWDPL